MMPWPATTLHPAVPALAAFVLSLALAACADDTTNAPTFSDTGVDAGSDAQLDTAADAIVDVQPDLPPDDDGAQPPDHPAQHFPDTFLASPTVRVDLMRVPGFEVPPNPVSGAPSPQAANVTTVFRYRREVEPPAPVRAILVMMPGFLGGAGSVDGLATALVERGQAEGHPVEVWAIDRRSNGLEDLRGMDTAELAGDPEIAAGYYLGGHTVDGAAFGGFVNGRSASWMSEWGLQTHVEDLRRVIARVPAEQRRAHVFLVGHSLGAAFAELYGAWRFEDGVRGSEELAGLVLLDGALGGTPLDEAAYDGGASGGPFPTPGVTAIRGGSVTTELPLLGVSVYVIAEILALRTLQAPDDVVADPARDNLLQILMGVQAPAMSNAAALGFGFDDAFCPLPFARLKMGEATGGPVESYTSFLSMQPQQRPTDPASTYTWIDAAEASEYTPIADFAEGMARGPGNFAEWYFPARLSLDISASAGANLPDDGWQAARGLRAFDGELDDAPVLAVAGGLVSVQAISAVSDRVAPVVGEGRPQAGRTRQDPEGFRVVDATDLAHIDVVMAPDGPANPIPAAILDFVDLHAVEGTVASP